jgi:hypothetical protein
MDFDFQWKTSPLSFFLGECKHKIIGLWLKMHSSSNHLVRIRKSVMSILKSVKNGGASMCSTMSSIHSMYSILIKFEQKG